MAALQLNLNQIRDEYVRNCLKQIQEAVNTGTSAGSLSAGMVFQCGGEVPEGFLRTDGKAVKTSQYPTLYKAIGTKYGDGTNGGIASGQGFNLPKDSDFGFPDGTGIIKV